MATRILAGGHDTPQGHAALRAAATEARDKGAELHVVGFVAPPKGGAPVEGYKNATQQMEQEVQRVVDEAVPAEVEVRVHVPQGVTRPSDAVLRVAAQEQVDLIVIGLRRRSRVGKLVLGSNAQDILLGAACPVLAVKDG